MYFGNRLFPQCEHSVISGTEEIQGQPDSQLLDSGLYTDCFFTKESDSPTPSWRLHTHHEYLSVSTFVCADHSVSENMPSENDPHLNALLECDETRAFLRLVKQMLIMDPKKRIYITKAQRSRFQAMRTFSSDTSPNNRPSAGYFMSMIRQVGKLSTKPSDKIKKMKAKRTEVHILKDDQGNERPPEKTVLDDATNAVTPLNS